jgi:uncharacterized protein (DUF1786 family)
MMSKQVKVQMGAGVITPAVREHLQNSNKAQPQPAKSKPVFGGGVITPAVAKHLTSKVSLGGGLISPAIQKHLQSR